jgi:hypothetical protein
MLGPEGPSGPRFEISNESQLVHSHCSVDLGARVLGGCGKSRKMHPRTLCIQLAKSVAFTLLSLSRVRRKFGHGVGIHISLFVGLVVWGWGLVHRPKRSAGFAKLSQSRNTSSSDTSVLGRLFDRPCRRIHGRRTLRRHAAVAVSYRFCFSHAHIVRTVLAVANLVRGRSSGPRVGSCMSQDQAGQGNIAVVGASVVAVVARFVVTSICGLAIRTHVFGCLHSCLFREP